MGRDLLEVLRKTLDNVFHNHHAADLEPIMNALTGMEKFSHLEDKIYLTIEYAKKMREEKDRLEKEAADLRTTAAKAVEEKEQGNLDTE
jgi:hypothetical protein